MQVAGDDRPVRSRLSARLGSGRTAGHQAAHARHPDRGLVPRPRLAGGSLTRDWGGGLILVCAPAGYGKTVAAGRLGPARRPADRVAVAGGGRQRPGPVLALRDRRAGPGIRGSASGSAPLLGPPALPSFEPLVTALINDLADEPRPGDVAADPRRLPRDRRPGGPRVSSGFLLEHRPPGLHLMLASRADPPLALARLRADAASSPSCAPPSCASPPAKRHPAAAGRVRSRLRLDRHRGGGAGGGHRGMGGGTAAGRAVAARSG